MRGIHRSILTAVFCLSAVHSTAMAGDLASFLDSHAGTEWTGTGELWLDPAGNDAELSDVSAQVQPDGIVYRWSFRGKQQTGRIQRSDDGLTWSDSWHQPDEVQLESIHTHGALAAGEYQYAAGSGPDWGWRIKLAQRPDGSLVLQMTNIPPWGEEARAVRMVLQRAS